MSKTFIVGISGGSGSGKTSFINQLKESFSKEEICFISQDDYYRPKEDQLEDGLGVTNYDLPTSINKKEFRKDLEKLMNGEVVERPEYTFNNAEAEVKMLVFHPAPIIVVEGLFIYHYKKVNKLLDLKVFVHAKENLKIIRRIKRDQLERNYPLDDVLYRYENHVLPSFEKYIEPYINDCDLVINNNEDFGMGLEVLKGFFGSRLTGKG